MLFRAALHVGKAADAEHGDAQRARAVSMFCDAAVVHASCSSHLRRTRAVELELAVEIDGRIEIALHPGARGVRPWRRRARRGGRANRASASVSASTSPDGNSIPVSSSRTSSGMPAMREPMTGRPAA